MRSKRRNFIDYRFLIIKVIRGGRAYRLFFLHLLLIMDLSRFVLIQHLKFLRILFTQRYFINRIAVIRKILVLVNRLNFLLLSYLPKLFHIGNKARRVFRTGQSEIIRTLVLQLLLIALAEQTTAVLLQLSQFQ